MNFEKLEATKILLWYLKDDYHLFLSAFCAFCSLFEYSFDDLHIVLWTSNEASYRSLLPLPLVAMLDPFVAVEGARLQERLRVDVALVWLGSAVDPQVYEEVQFLFSCPTAARVLAVIVRLLSFGSLV